MLSFWARALLGATAVSPFLLGLAVIYAFRRPLIAVALFAFFLLMVWLCERLLAASSRRLPRRPIPAESVKIADQSMLSFLLAYMFPLVFIGASGLTLSGLGILALLVVLFLVALYRTNSYSFNPVMGLVLGYHFYEVTTKENFTYLVVSQRKIVNTERVIQGRELSPYMYLEAKG